MRRRLHPAAGVTLMEVIIVVAVSSVIMIIAYDLIESAMRTSLFVESHNQLAQLAQRPVNAMTLDAFQSRVIYQNNANGTTYLAKVVAQLPTAYPIQADYQLPLANSSTNLIAPDDPTGPNYVGNCLLVLKQLNPLAIQWNNGSANVNFPADLYRFDFYYLSQNTSRSFGGQGHFVDLIRWRSTEYADYSQLASFFANSALSATEKAKIVTGLSGKGITIAVDASGTSAANSSFYTIGSDVTNGGKLTAIANPTIAKLANDASKQIWCCQSILPELGTGSVSGKMLFTVGFVTNPSFIPSNLVIDPMPKYAFAKTGSPNYITGFEVKVVGTGASQKTMLRLVLLANYQAGRYDSREGTAIISK